VCGHIQAVQHVSLNIAQGETLGLVGESGCGKTTFGRCILQLEKKTAGNILFQGEDLHQLSTKQRRILRREMQMIFQDPYSSLNPRMCALDLITEGIREHKLEGWKNKDAAGIQLMREVGLDPESRFRFPHEFSGGQRQRLSIARVLSMHPKFIVCDEPVSALDVSVQAQIINLLRDLRSKYRLTYLFISHDLSVVRLISHRVAVMYLGQIVEYGNCSDIFEHPLHPYTQALISAIPTPGMTSRNRIILKGEIPSPLHPPIGCAFHPRCSYATDRCSKELPELRNVKNQTVACHYAEQFL